MSFLNKVLPYAAGAGALYLGGQMFGGSAAPIAGTVGAANQKSFLSGIDPTIASAGIFAATSLFSSLFGTDLDQERIDLANKQFDAEMAYKNAALAQNKELTLAQIAASGQNAGAAKYAANAAAGAARRQSDIQLAGQRATAQGNAADRKAAAVKDMPGVIAAGRSGQAAAAQRGGESGQRAFSDYIRSIQGPMVGG